MKTTKRPKLFQERLDSHMNKIIVISGPSGVGKSSFLKRILLEIEELESTVTYTTRKIRKNEVEGKNYHFVDKETFKSLIRQSFFVEWAEVHSHLYGTAKDQILNIWKRKKTVILDVDVQGARNLQKAYPQVFLVFLLPPNPEELRKRIQKRGALEKEEMRLRLVNAKKEIEESKLFDFCLINEDFDSAYLSLKRQIIKYLEFS